MIYRKEGVRGRSETKVMKGRIALSKIFALDLISQSDSIVDIILSASYGTLKSHDFFYNNRQASLA